MLGVLGGGDAKLLMAVGAFMGPRDLLVAMLVIASLGGIMAAMDAVRKGILLPVLYNCGSILKHWATFGRRGSQPFPRRPPGRWPSPTVSPLPWGAGLVVRRVRRL